RCSRHGIRCGEADRECGSGAADAFAGDRAAVRLDETSADVQSESVSVGSFGREERLPDAFGNRLRNAAAVVADIDADAVAILLQADADPAVFAALDGIRGILNEVGQNLLQLE